MSRVEDRNAAATSVPSVGISGYKTPVPPHVTKALGERRNSSYSFSTSALDGVSGQPHAPAAF
jgi:hypothetical protein